MGDQFGSSGLLEYGNSHKKLSGPGVEPEARNQEAKPRDNEPTKEVPLKIFEAAPP